MSSAARLRVRPAEARDLDRVCAIVNHFIETTAFNFRIESQQVQEWLHNWERLHRLYPWLVAIAGQRVIGVAYAAPWKARDAYLWTVESTVYVDHECHRRGVATPCTPSCWPGWNARVFGPRSGLSRCPTRPVSDCTSGTGSSRSGCWRTRATN